MFGFQSYPQRPSPNRRQVGEALVMQQQSGGAGLETAPGPMGFQSPTPSGDPGAFGDPAEHELRAQGGRSMGGAGQTGWGSGGGDSPDEPNPSAIAAAVGEALTRMGGGIMRDPNPHVDRERRKRDVMQLGVSPFEADLLTQSGGL